MANKTQHYSLTKPTPEEFYSVEDQNGNMDIIDDALKNHKHSASDITSDILSVDRGGTGSDDLSNITVGNAQKFNGKGFSQLFDSNNKALKAVQADAATQATTAGKAQDSDKLGGIAASGYSQTNHKHSASDITSGTLPVAHGGIGATSLANITVGNASKLGGVAASEYLQNSGGTITGNLKTTGKVTASGGFSGTISYSDLTSVPGSTNLLANPDFSIVSSSSTSTKESGTYLADRWIFYTSGDGTASLQGGHMVVTGGTTGSSTLQQAVNPSKFWKSNSGNKVTFACVAKGEFTLRIAAGKYGSASSTKVCSSINWELHTATFDVPQNDGQVTFSFYIPVGKTATIQWAKVNYGSQYATYSPPGTENSIVVPTLLNGWEKMEEGNLSIAKSGNIVTLNCSLSNTSASSSTPFIIPEGYRPEGTIGFFNSDRDLGWIRWWSGEVMLYDKFTEVLLNTSYVATH